MAIATEFDVRTGQEKDPKRARTTNKRKTAAVLLSERLFKLYDTPARQTWAKNALEDDLFRNNVQWSREHVLKLKEREQMPSVENLIYPAVEQAKGFLTAHQPRWSATAKEMSDTGTAAAVADLFEHIWYHSRGNTQLKVFVDDGYVRSMGVLMAYHDPNADFGNGEICIKAIDPFDVYIDPNSTDPFARDAEHILIVQYLSGARLEVLYPQLRQILETATPTRPRNIVSSDRVALEGQTIGRYYEQDINLYEVIDRYSKIKIQSFKAIDSTRQGAETIIENEESLQAFAMEPVVKRVQAGQETFITDPVEVQNALQLLQQTGGVFHMITDPTTGQPVIQPGPEAEDELAIAGSEVVLLQETMEALIQAGIVQIKPILEDRILRVFSIGGVECYADYLPKLTEYPITFWMHDHNRNPYPQSAVRKVRPIQEYVNKTQSLIVAHAANSTNVKVFYPRGGVDKNELKREFSKAGFGSMAYDAELGQVVIAAPIPLPNELYHNKQSARESIYEIFGLYPFQQGDPRNAPDTYKGTLALEEFGQRRMKSKKDDIEESLNQLGRAVLQMIQATYTQPKVIRLLGPNNQPKESKINYPLYDTVGVDFAPRVNDVTIGEYDVVVVSGSTLPTNRWARFDAYLELFDRHIVDQVEVLKQTDIPDMETLLERSGQIQQLQQTISQLQEQVKQLGGDLQTAQRESVQDRKRVEVEKFKANLKSISSRAEAATVVYQKRLSDDEVSRRKQAQKQSKGT